MQIVIELSEKDLDDIKYNDYIEGTYYTMLDAITNGMPLPKGHGRLIDADKAKENMMYEMCGTGYQIRAMNVLNEYNAPTIIEKDDD